MQSLQTVYSLIVADLINSGIFDLDEDWLKKLFIF